MCKAEELKIVLRESSRKLLSSKCVLRTHLNFSEELINTLSNKYNILVATVNKKYLEDDVDVTIQNVQYLNTKVTFSLFAEELKKIIDNSFRGLDYKNDNELLKEHIINYNKCNRCHNFLSCTCRVCNVNGINIQYNVIDSNPDIVLCITQPNLHNNAIETLETLTEYHKIKLVVYDKPMSKNYPIVGINLDRIPLGVMTNIVTVISEDLHKR